MSGKYNSQYNQVHLLENLDYIKLYSSESEDELYCICINNKFTFEKVQQMADDILSNYSLTYRINSIYNGILYYNEHNETWSMWNYEDLNSEKLWIIEVSYDENNEFNKYIESVY